MFRVNVLRRRGLILTQKMATALFAETLKKL
jgi:hypothetical protein